MNNTDTGASAPSDLKFSGRNFSPLNDDVKPTSWLIKGVIPEGCGIISGNGGVGKTSCIVPLALLVAGISAPACNLEVKRARKVIYITEDKTQVENILQGMRHFLNWNDEAWSLVKKQFLILESFRMNNDELTELLADIDEMKLDESDVQEFPLVVFDTGSANFEINNESDNSEVGRFTALLKQWREREPRLKSAWVSAHLSKGAKGQSIDEILNFGSRGASAWEDNMNWVGLISSSEKDNKGYRVLKTGKIRVVPEFQEINFKGSERVMTASDGSDVHYRYLVPERGAESLRKQESAIARDDEMKKRFIDAFSECKVSHPDRSEILSLVKGKSTQKAEFLNGLIAQREVFEYPIPDGNIREGKRSKTYLSLSSNG
jgi:hypothetical protein